MLEGETLLVFADDWGAHPSSAQHLLRRFLPANRVIWVNTVGLRLPRLSLRDVRKIVGKLRHWSGRPGAAVQTRPEVHELALFPLQLGWAARSVNAWILSRSVRRWLRGAPRPPFIVSTLPLTADLPAAVPDGVFVYYVVDDYASWPGLGGHLVQTLDEAQSRRADLVVAASRALVDLHQPRARGKVEYLPHGVDIAHFARARDVRARESPIADVVFFGALDERIDRQLLGAAIRTRPALRFLLVGPGLSQPDPETDAINVERREEVSYDELPKLLGRCRVALLPYVRSKFGERLSPLKAREALAAGLPVVATDIPELRSLPGGVHLTNDADRLANLLDATLARPDVPTLAELAADSWEMRAERLSELLLAARAARRSP